VLLLRHIHAISAASVDGKDPAEADAGIADTIRELLSVRPAADGGGVDAGPPIVIATTHESVDELPGGLVACFVHTIDLLPPDEEHRTAILDLALEGLSHTPDVSVSAVGRATAGCTARDLNVLVRQVGSPAFLAPARLGLALTACAGCWAPVPCWKRGLRTRAATSCDQ